MVKCFLTMNVVYFRWKLIKIFTIAFHVISLNVWGFPSLDLLTIKKDWITLLTLSMQPFHWVLCAWCHQSSCRVDCMSCTSGFQLCPHFSSSASLPAMFTLLVLSIEHTSTAYQHCIPTLHTITAYQHCIPSLHTITAYLHCIPTLHTNTASV